MLNSAHFDETTMDFPVHVAKPGQHYSDIEQPKTFVASKHCNKPSSDSEGSLNKLYHYATSLPGKLTLCHTNAIYHLHVWDYLI